MEKWIKYILILYIEKYIADEENSHRQEVIMLKLSLNLLHAVNALKISLIKTKNFPYSILIKKTSN